MWLVLSKNFRGELLILGGHLYKLYLCVAVFTGHVAEAIGII